MKVSTYVVTPRDHGRPLGDFLADELGLSKKRAKAVCDSRLVFVNGKRVWMARHTLRKGDSIEVRREQAIEAPGRVPILYEDADYVIADKSPGILTNGPNSLEARLRAQTGNPVLQAVHRLDRDTSGCILFAGHRSAFDAMIPLFQTRRLTKVYQAIAIGRVPGDVHEIAKPIEGQSALTRLQILDANPRATHLRLALDTGRTHQIRIHLSSIHHPLAGERMHIGRLPHAEEFRAVPRQMLHAVRLVFRQPLTGEPVRAQAPLPADYRECLRWLRLS